MYISMYSFEACLGCIMMWKKCLLKVNMYSMIQLDPHQVVGVATFEMWHTVDEKRKLLYYILWICHKLIVFFFKWSEHILKKKKKEKIREKEKKKCIVIELVAMWNMHGMLGNRRSNRKTFRSLFIHLKGAWFFMGLEVEGGPDISFLDI